MQLDIAGQRKLAKLRFAFQPVDEDKRLHRTRKTLLEGETSQLRIASERV